MGAFLIKIAAGFFKVHPATVQTKTFFGGLGLIATAVLAVVNMVQSGDTTFLDYLGAGVPLVAGITAMFIRDSHTKTAIALQKLEDLLKNTTAK